MKNITLTDITNALIEIKVDIQKYRYSKPIKGNRRFNIPENPKISADLENITDKLLTRFPQLTRGQIAHFVSEAANL